MVFPVLLEYLGMALIAPREYIRIAIVERRTILHGFLLVLVFSIVNGLLTGYTLVGKMLVFIGIPWLGTLTVLGAVLFTIVASIAL
ncbi:MAG: hypothetical protein J7K21_05895 [Desulfurococcales archaeon]|nr:hypothetical protein [Desulfurococcales archaeon]